jgi:hypothetical protein
VNVRLRAGKQSLVLATLVAAGAMTVTGCGDQDPPASPDAPPEIDAAIDAPPPIDGPPIDSAVMCMAAATDYTPRENMSMNDPYPMCISDATPDRYSQIGASVSTIARIAAFEEIAQRLFIAGAPSNQAFIDARAQYELAEGLGSRASRREDEHYPPAPMACNAAGFDPTQFPERCVGPVKLVPLVQSALMTGSASADARERRLAAARVEAGLLWFLYVSVHKEATTCKAAPADCDSHWAYYTGGEHRDAGKGFARYVRALDLETHQRIFDGILAVRCWRGLDVVADPDDDAMYAAFRTQAIAQLDTAAIRGVVLIIKSRLLRLESQTGVDAEVTWEMLRNYGPVLHRAANAQGGQAATDWTTEIAKPGVPDQAARNKMHRALDVLFPCP